MAEHGVQSPEFEQLSQLSVSWLERYGWFVVAIFAVLFFLKPTLERWMEELSSWATTRQDPEQARALESKVAAARQRQQDERKLAENDYNDRQRELRAQAAQQRLADLDRKAEGLGIKPKGDGRRLGSEPDQPGGDSCGGQGASADSALRPAPAPRSSQPAPAPPRSSGFNPLSGSGGGNAGFRSTRRGPSRGG